MTDTKSARSPLVAITGGASGIGRACAEALIARWPTSKVAIIDTDAALAREVATEFTEARCLAVLADVSDSHDVRRAFEEIRDWSPPGVTHLVTCAANYIKRPSIDITPEEWHSVLRVHLDGTLFACQAAAHQMKGAGGSIVTFSSVAELFAWPARLAYAVAKAGISAMTRTLAVEWAELGIRVNAVAPGYVNTPLIDSAISSGVITEDVASLHALNRVASAAEIANAVLFLLSNDSSFVTGETMYVDGGFHAKKVRW